MLFDLGVEMVKRDPAGITWNEWEPRRIITVSVGGVCVTFNNYMSLFHYTGLVVVGLAPSIYKVARSDSIKLFNHVSCYLSASLDVAPPLVEYE